MILFIERVKGKYLRWYWKRAFLKTIHCENATGCHCYGKVDVRATNVHIGDNVHIYGNVTLWGDGPIIIGNNVDIGYNTILFSKKSGGITIGNNVSIAAHSYIIDSNHGIKLGELIREQEMSTQPISIGNDVWIADNCTILKGSIIEDGAVIGAKSLVNSNISSNGIAVGVPAKIIKYRSTD